ncbi:hypothetical protein LTS18_013002, partial [Coniosporium uncinatum]
MDDLASLELLGLVSKVASEIQNHIGIADKTLSEFIIQQHVESKGRKEFENKLAELGADFPQSLIVSLDRQIRGQHPHYRNEDGEPEKPTRDEQSDVFKGLSIPDKEPAWEQQEPEEEDAKEAVIDDTFAMLEGLAGKPSRKRRSPSPEVRPSKRHRSRSPRRRHRDRSRSPQPRRDRDDRFKRPPTPEVDDEPVPYKVYDGWVTGVKDFGAFVRLKGVRGKVDGLVHVSAMTEGRVNHPSDLVGRDQVVKVKVMKIENNRISLSMKEVDQETGQDLAPQRRLAFASGANSEGLGGNPIGNGKYGNLSSDVPVVENNGYKGPSRPKKRMTSPERWEIRQMIASGVLSAHDYPDLNEHAEAVDENGQIEEEEEIDIELKESEPPFLAGQTKMSL